MCWVLNSRAAFGAAACDKVVHFWLKRYLNVTQRPDFQGLCQSVKNLSCKFKALRFCLFFRQITEAGLKQRKFPGPEFFPSDLSKETVDRFSLAPPHASLQQGRRIAVSEMGLLLA